ncbi:MAG: hypothetical protein ACJ76N_11240 [Thermoanaerobaculia bacterium]
MAASAQSIGTVIGTVHHHHGEERIKRLSVEQHFQLLECEKLHRFRMRLYFEREMIEPLVHQLEQRPLLFLVGDPGLGKTSTALLTSGFLWDRNQAKRAPQDKVLLCHHLESNVRVDFSEVTGGDKYQNKILIFKDAFSAKNQDFVRFSSDLAGDRIDSWCERLRQNNSLLIVTTEGANIPCPREKLKSLGVLHELEEPSTEYLLDGLRHLARRLLAGSEGQFENIRPELIEELIASEGELIAKELRGMARIDALASEYLPQVLREEISLQEAIRRVNDFGPWLLQELPEHPSTWATVVALVLCSASPAQESAPWCQFEAIRRALLQHVSREQGQRRYRRSLREICGGDDLLRQARAEIVRESSPVRVQFLERRYPDLLWEVLLGRGRDVTATVIPLLKTLAEGDDLYTGRAAASALGRIGQIDPRYITYPLLRKWSAPNGVRENRRDFRDRGALLGSFFQGVLGAREDEEYQCECLQFLQWLLQSSVNSTVQAAVVSLADIAISDHSHFEFAMRALRDVVEKRLGPQWAILRKLADTMRELGQNGGKKKVLLLLETILEVQGDIDDIPRFAATVFDGLIVARESLPILVSFEAALSRLFLSHQERRALLERLVEWLQEDQDKLGPAVTYLFLKSAGISSRLVRLASLPRSNEGEEAVGSLFLESVYDDPKGIVALSRFLEQLYIHIRVFPGLLRVLLEESYVRLLASCAREGKFIPRLRPTVVEILGHLFESRDEEMNSCILRLAQEHPASPDLTDLRQLAAEAVTRPSQH